MNIEIHLSDIATIRAAENGCDFEIDLATTISLAGNSVHREQFINDLLEAEDDLGSEAMFAMLKRIADDKGWELSERDPGPEITRSAYESDADGWGEPKPDAHTDLTILARDAGLMSAYENLGTIK